MSPLQSLLSASISTIYIAKMFKMMYEGKGTLWASPSALSSASLSVRFESVGTELVVRRTDAEVVVGIGVGGTVVGGEEEDGCCDVPGSSSLSGNILASPPTPIVRHASSSNM
jgi:hypothetical protein